MIGPSRTPISGNFSQIHCHYPWVQTALKGPPDFRPWEVPCPPSALSTSTVLLPLVGSPCLLMLKVTELLCQLVLFFKFCLQCWGWNSGPWAGKAKALPLHRTPDWFYCHCCLCVFGFAILVVQHFLFRRGDFQILKQPNIPQISQTWL